MLRYVIMKYYYITLLHKTPKIHQLGLAILATNKAL